MDDAHTETQKRAEVKSPISMRLSRKQDNRRRNFVSYTNKIAKEIDKHTEGE